jgi:hypothetical protein
MVYVRLSALDTSVNSYRVNGHFGEYPRSTSFTFTTRPEPLDVAENWNNAQNAFLFTTDDVEELVVFGIRAFVLARFNLFEGN